jgi:signal peptidase II
MRPRLPYIGVIAVVILLDQLTKHLVTRFLDLHEYRSLVDGVLSLSHVQNHGAAFGILSDAELPYQAAVFSALSLLALCAIAGYALRLPPEPRLPLFALSLVLGGALGNLVDRLRLGYVVDFIHVYWKRYQWPDFNVADSAITVGVALLIVDILRSPQSDDARKPEMMEAARAAGRTE